MLKKHDIGFIVDGGPKYEGLKCIVSRNPKCGWVEVLMENKSQPELFDETEVRLLERPYLPFYEALSIAEEGDILLCEYNGYQRIVCDDKYAFTWEDSEKTVKLVGEFLGMNWKIVREAL